VSRRLFVAFALAAPCRRVLARAADRLAARLDVRAGARTRLTWVEPENLHVTVRFLGATPEPDVEAVRAVLRPPLASPPVEFCFDRVRTFPDGGRPRVLWAGSTGGSAAAAQVRREVDARLEAAGLARETQPFGLHVTLARFREPGRASDARAIAEFVMDVPATARAAQVTLFESRPGRRGPIYYALERTELRGEPGIAEIP
jgi:2'-5' RNA ligase